MSDPADFIIDDAKVHLAASKSKDSRTRVTQRFAVLIHFLQTSGLTTRELLADGDQVTSDLQIRRSDLTEIGFQVMRSGYDKWLRGIDRGKPVDDVSILIKALADATK